MAIITRIARSGTRILVKELVGVNERRNAMGIVSIPLVLIVGGALLFFLSIFLHVATCQSDLISISRWSWNEMACYQTGYYNGEQLTTYRTDIWLNTKGYLSKEQEIKQIEFGLYSLPVEYYDLATQKVMQIPEKEVERIKCDAMRKMMIEYKQFYPYECGGIQYEVVCADKYCMAEPTGWKKR